MPPKTNKYLSLRQPWTLVNKSDPTENRDRIRLTVYLCAESLRICGILLQTFIPGSAKHLLDMLGVDLARRTFAHARPHEDGTYGASLVELGRGLDKVLFPPLSSNE